MHDLETAGLRVQKSFDLQSACASLSDSTCPHHGSAPCDCQLIVLLVYGAGSRPVSLILHSHRGQSELQWDQNPAYPPDPESRAFIQQILYSGAPVPADFDQEPYVGIE